MSLTTDRRPAGPGPTVHEAVTAPPAARGDAEGRSSLTGENGQARAGDRVLRSTRALLVAFVVFTALAVVSLLGLSGHTDTAFAWTIRSRPNAAFLGAAYAAGLVLSVLALGQRRWTAVRVPVVTVTVFTALTLIPTLLHKHRLNLMAPAGTARLAAWVWLAVYVAVPLAGAAVVVRQHRQEQRRRGAGRDEEPVVVRPIPAPLVALLVAQGAALAVVGAILFAGGARIHMMVDLERPGWPWPVTPLTSMVIGAWLLSFAVAIALAVRERDLTRMRVPALAYAAFGAFELAVVLAHRTAAGTRPVWWWTAALVLASIVLAGIYGAWAVRRGPRA
jgi:hypothetical protein